MARDLCGWVGWVALVEGKHLRTAAGEHRAGTAYAALVTICCRRHTLGAAARAAASHAGTVSKSASKPSGSGLERMRSQAEPGLRRAAATGCFAAQQRMMS